MALSKEEISEIKLGVNKAKKKVMAFAFAKKRKDGGKDPKGPDLRGGLILRVRGPTQS